MHESVEAVVKKSNQLRKSLFWTVASGLALYLIYTEKTFPFLLSLLYYDFNSNFLVLIAYPIIRLIAFAVFPVISIILLLLFAKSIDGLAQLITLRSLLNIYIINMVLCIIVGLLLFNHMAVEDVFNALISRVMLYEMPIVKVVRVLTYASIVALDIVLLIDVSLLYKRAARQDVTRNIKAVGMIIQPLIFAVVFIVSSSFLCLLYLISINKVNMPFATQNGIVNVDVMLLTKSVFFVNIALSTSVLGYNAYISLIRLWDYVVIKTKCKELDRQEFERNVVERFKQHNDFAISRLLLFIGIALSLLVFAFYMWMKFGKYIELLSQI